ncbi:MAG: complex I subunit 4 family protein, partial [Ktedonobacterales bacterium]
GLPQHIQILLFLAFFAAFAVKTGLFPFHSWVADTYSEAPVPVVVLVAGVMAKTGAYGFVRFCLGLFPAASRQLTGFMGVLAVIGILYFALQALAALDFKRLLAYVSISHMSVIILGIFALNTQGIEGGILQMVNHGVIIAGLFLIAGYIETRTSSRRLADFGGLATRLPWLATVFLLVTLSALGLPGLNSFGGEFLAFLGAFRSNVVFGALGTLVVIPAAWYMLRFFQGVMHGQPVEVAGVATNAAGQASTRQRKRGHAGGLPDLRIGEFAVLLPLLVLVVYLGFAPGVLTTPMESTVTRMIPTFATTPTPTSSRLTPPSHVGQDAAGLGSLPPPLPQVRGPGGEVRASRDSIRAGGVRWS